MRDGPEVQGGDVGAERRKPRDGCPWAFGSGGQRETRPSALRDRDGSSKFDDFAGDGNLFPSKL